MFWTPHILRAFCCCMARGTGPGISNYYHERIRGVTKNASVKVQHEIGRKTAAYTAKRLSKCCNYCIVAVLVAGGSTQNVSLSVVAAKGCPTKISQMLDQGAWRISHLCRGCRRSAATVWIWGKKNHDQTFNLSGVLSGFGTYGNRWPQMLHHRYMFS